MKQTIFEKADWIFVDCEETEICDQYFEYRTKFDANPHVPTKLYISAYSQYVVYINGHFVNSGQYDDYEDYQIYDSLDISAYINNQDNDLYIGHYVCGGDFSTRRKQKPGIIFDIWNEKQNLLSSNCKCFSRENRHFLENRECISGQLGYNFEYDATTVEAEYRSSILAGKVKRLFPRPIKKLEVLAYHGASLSAGGLFVENDASLPKAVRMQTAYLSTLRQEDYFKGDGKEVSWKMHDEKRADGIWLIFDLGQESTGLLEFSLEVSEETEVLIGFGEHLDDMRVRSVIGKRNFCFRYVARKGRNEFFYPFQRIGLRYMQFHVYSKTGTLSVGIKEQHYPVTRYTLPLVDKLHQRIYEVGCNTLELCMHEHYEDCPWREQALYAMDSRIQMLCGYYAFKEYEFPKANLLLMLHSMRSDGLLELCAPGKVSVNIPSYSAVFVRAVLEYVEYSNDVAFLEEIFTKLQRLVEGFVKRILENHLVPLYCGSEYWNFYEWREGIDGGTDFEPGTVDCLLNTFISDAFRCFALICEKVGRAGQGERYYRLHRNMNQAMHQMFFDEKTGAYCSNLADNKPKHVLTQGMMLYVDAVPDEWIEKVTHAITDGDLIPSSISMSIYVYESLLKCSEKYKGYVLNEIERIWGKMLSAGADTFWETDLGADDFGKAGSLCHGWSAAPVYLFGKYFETI